MRGGFTFTKRRRRGNGGGGVGRGLGFGGAFGFPAAASDGDVAEDAAFGPVSPAALAEVPRLREIIVIVITEFGVERITPRALQRLVVLVVVEVRPQAPVSATASAEQPTPSGDRLYILHFPHQTKKKQIKNKKQQFPALPTTESDSPEKPLTFGEKPRGILKNGLEIFPLKFFLFS